MAERKPPTGVLPNRALSSSMPNMDEILPLIKKESELHKMLTDEKMRADKHRNNYVSLKEQFERLQQEMIFMKERIPDSNIGEALQAAELRKYQTVIDKLESELAKKDEEISELTKYSLSPGKYDALKLEILQELQVPFKVKLDEIERDFEENQNRYNALRHDYAFLKSEYDFCAKEHDRILTDLELRQTAEIEALKKEKEDVVKTFSSESDKESARVKNLMKENAHLTHRVKSLEQAIEEKDAQVENRSDADSHISRFQAKQLVEMNGKIKILEATNSSLKTQAESLEDELKRSNDFNHSLNDKVLQVEKENLGLKNKLEELKHEESLARNNLKIESMIKYNDVVKERDSLKAEMDDISTKLETVEHVIEKQKSALAQKEREITRRVQSVKDSDWMKVAQLQDKNAELEAKVQDYENFKSDLLSRETDVKVRLQEQIGAIERQKMELEKQLLLVETQLEAKEDLEKELERERNEHSNAKKKLMTAQNELLSTQNIESEMMTDVQRLKSSMESLKQQNQILRQELETLQDRTNAEKLHYESQWSHEKQRLTERNQFLDDQVAKLNKKLQNAAQIHLRQKKNYEVKFAKLLEKSDALEAKEMELTMEKRQLETSVPYAAFEEVKQNLSRVEKRYRDLLEAKSGDPRSDTTSQRSTSRREGGGSLRENIRFAETEHISELPGSHKPTVLFEKPERLEVPEKGFFDETVCSKVDGMYMKELESLKERLERLSEVQKEQMKNFLGTDEAQDIANILDLKDVTKAGLERKKETLRQTGL